MTISPDTNGKTYHGGCHCGAVTFVINGPLRAVRVCHCRDCLKLAGFTWSATNVPEDQITFTAGEEMIDWYQSSDIAVRGFCKSCHSQMFYRLHGTTALSVAPGALDNHDGLEVEGHIWRKGAPHICRGLDALDDLNDK